MTCERFRHFLYQMDPRNAMPELVSSMWRHARYCQRCKQLVPKAFVPDVEKQPEREAVSQ